MSLLETAVLGPTGQGAAGANIDVDQYLGAKFDVATASRVVRLGGHFIAWVPAGSIFAAIVPLDPQTDLPASPNLSDAVFATTFQPPSPSDEVTLCADVLLEPGRYGLIFGTTLFGATGAALTPLVDTVESPQEFFRGLPGSGEWLDLPGDMPMRFFVFADTDSVTTGGLPHFALGAAQVASSSSTELQVSNLGSSGLDGVAIDVGRALGWGGSVDAMAGPGTLSAAAIGRVGGAPGQTAASITLEDDGNGAWYVRSSFPVNSSSPMAVDVFSGGALVAQPTIAQNDRFSMTCYLDGFRVPCWTIRIYLDFSALPFFCDWSIDFGPFGVRAGSVTVEVEVDGQVYVGDRVGTRALSGSEPAVELDYASQIRLLSSDTGSFVLADESILAVDLFADGFESGNTSAWSTVIDP